jgi:EAL domain-containing protein (putative c-di-GMP-specific phosphodiesterase class I)
MGIDVVAEGVETLAQRDFLLARGCTRAQGHLYWAAMPTDEVETLISGDARDGILT